MSQNADESGTIPTGMNALSFLDNLGGMAYRCRWDGDWVMEYVSRGCVGLTGHSREELTSAGTPSWSELIHPQDLVGVVKKVRHAVDNRQPFYSRYRLAVPGRGIRTVLDEGRVVSPEGVFPRYIEGYIAEESLGEPAPTEERIEALPDDAARTLERARDPFLAVDARGTIVAWNRRCEETFGWARREAIGQDIATLLVPTGQRARFTEKFFDLITNPAPQIVSGSTNIHAVRRNGESFPVELSVWPSNSRGGLVLNGFVIDLTEQRALEQQLAKAEESLERLRREDMLTGLASRRTLDGELVRAVSFSRRWGQPLSVLVVGPDPGGKELKAAELDQLLVAIAGQLKVTCRVEDLPARMDSNKFAILLPNTGAGNIPVVVERILRCLEHDPATSVVPLHLGAATLEGGEDHTRLVGRAIKNMERTQAADPAQASNRERGQS